MLVEQVEATPQYLARGQVLLNSKCGAGREGPTDVGVSSGGGK